MRFVIINTDYPGFLDWLYASHPGLQNQPYEEQARVRNATFFGTSDVYSQELKQLGHDAIDLHVNNRALQLAWAREHGVAVTPESQWRFWLRRGVLPWAAKVRNSDWLYDVLGAQIAQFRPDVVYTHALDLWAEFYRGLKPAHPGDPGVGRLIGQHASPLPRQDVRWCDLVFSSLPNQVEHFRRLGVRSSYLPLAFDPRVLAQLQPGPKRYDVVFAGGLGGPHHPGTRLLESVCTAVENVAIFGYGIEHLPASSPIRRCYSGPLWGVAMFQALRDTRIVLNRHIDAAGPYANNMRLYETTGVGSFLLTERKQNLGDLFAPGREVAVYDTPEQAVELVRHYLGHEAEREAIAQAGQARTLREHTYPVRLPQLLELLDPRSARRAAA
jgi:spore maturation protein CgeB